MSAARETDKGQPSPTSQSQMQNKNLQKGDSAGVTNARHARRKQTPKFSHKGSLFESSTMKDRFAGTTDKLEITRTIFMAARENSAAYLEAILNSDGKIAVERHHNAKLKGSALEGGLPLVGKIILSDFWRVGDNAIKTDFVNGMIHCVNNTCTTLQLFSTRWLVIWSLENLFMTYSI